MESNPKKDLLITFSILVTSGLESHGRFNDFLCKGQYDPRILCSIVEFLDRKCTNVVTWARLTECEAHAEQRIQVSKQMPAGWLRGIYSSNWTSREWINLLFNSPVVLFEQFLSHPELAKRESSSVPEVMQYAFRAAMRVGAARSCEVAFSIPLFREYVTRLPTDVRYASTRLIADALQGTDVVCMRIALELFRRWNPVKYAELLPSEVFGSDVFFNHIERGNLAGLGQIVDAFELKVSPKYVDQRVITHAFYSGNTTMLEYWQPMFPRNKYDGDSLDLGSVVTPLTLEFVQRFLELYASKTFYFRDVDDRRIKNKLSKGSGWELIYHYRFVREDKPPAAVKRKLDE